MKINIVKEPVVAPVKEVTITFTVEEAQHLRAIAMDEFNCYESWAKRYKRLYPGHVTTYFGNLTYELKCGLEKI